MRPVGWIDGSSAIERERSLHFIFTNNPNQPTMGYYVSNMIGIRLGGVFSGATDMGDLSRRVIALAEKHNSENEGERVPISASVDGEPPYDQSFKMGLPNCMSRELVARKGGMAVIAGVFNYWTFDRVAPFAASLSEEFGTEVMVMSYDEEKETVQCQIFLGGKPLHEINESPLGQILRRIT